MELYMSPLSCSFAVHVACLEAELPVTLRRVDRRTKTLDDGADYRVLSPLGLVPLLAPSTEAPISEMGAVLQWVADRAPDKGLAPRWGSQERYELIAWIHFVGTEIHKKHLSFVFGTQVPDAVKAWAREQAGAAFSHVAKRLGDREYVVGNAFTVADAYLFWSLLIAPHGGISLDAWPNLPTYVGRLQSRPSIVRALAVEYPMFKQTEGRA